MTDTSTETTAPTSEPEAPPADETATDASPPAAGDVREGDPAEEGQTGRRGKNPSAEAARYRQELRAAETERDTLRGRLARYQRNEVGRLAEKAGATRGDDVADVTDLASLLGEDGEVDPEKVTARVTELRAERPHWFAPGPRVRRRPVGGREVQDTSEAAGSGDDWGFVIRG